MKLKFLVFVLFVGCAPLAAQVTYTPYSYYGLGVTRPRGAPINRIYGGSGIGLFDGANLNTANPAALNNIGGVSFMTNAGFLVEKGEFSNRTETSKYTTGRLTSIDMWFRLSQKWSSAIGFTPLSFIDYNVKASSNGSQGGAQLSGQGGFNQIYWSHSYQVIKNLNIGLTGNYVQGTVNHSQLISAGTLANTKFSDDVSGQGLGFDLGAQYSRSVWKNYFVTAGLIYSSKVNLSKTHDASLSQQGYSLWSVDNVYGNERLAVPRRLGGGLGIQQPHWNLTADLTYIYWKNADNTDPFRDVWRLAAGGEYRLRQSLEAVRPPISLRGGVYFGPNELALGGNYNDWGLCFGVGLPVADNRGVFHIGYQFNQTGTHNQALLLQHANTLILDFTFRDLWGIRRKNE